MPVELTPARNAADELREPMQRVGLERTAGPRRGGLFSELEMGETVASSRRNVVEAPGIEPAKIADLPSNLNGSAPEEPSEVPPNPAKSHTWGQALGTVEAPLQPASYSAIWAALEGAAGALTAEVLAALRQGDVARARIAVRSLAAIVEACAGAGAGQGVALEVPLPTLAPAAASADPLKGGPCPKPAGAAHEHDLMKNGAGDEPLLAGGLPAERL